MSLPLLIAAAIGIKGHCPTYHDYSKQPEGASISRAAIRLCQLCTQSQFRCGCAIGKAGGGQLLIEGLFGRESCLLLKHDQAIEFTARIGLAPVGRVIDSDDLIPFDLQAAKQGQKRQCQQQQGPPHSSRVLALTGGS